MLLLAKDKFALHSLSIDEFYRNKQFYFNSFDDIAKSIKIPPFTMYEAEFFDKHPINSFLYVKENDKIVAILYSTPHRDYSCYKEFGTNDFSRWGVNYIQVHKDYSGKGYGYLMLLAGLEDIKNKGGKKIEFMPNRKSASLFHHAVYDNNIGDVAVVDKMNAILSISFNKHFLNLNSSILDFKQTHTRHTHKSIKPYRDFYDYYMFKGYPQLLEKINEQYEENTLTK